MLRRVSVRTGIPLRRLQDWGGLALALLFSVLAAGVAWGIDRYYLLERAPLERLIAGGAVLAAAYGAILLLKKLKP
jgi:hypothetical protein